MKRSRESTTTKMASRSEENIILKKENGETRKRKQSTGSSKKPWKKPKKDKKTFPERKPRDQEKVAAESEAKKLWNKIREKTTEDDERKQMVQDLCEILVGNIPQFSLRPDMGRALQCAFRYGSEEQRTTILKEMEPSLFSLAKSKHGNFLVENVLRYGNDAHRKVVMNALRSHIHTLGVHAHGARVLNVLFRPNEDVSDRLMSGFYGTEYLMHVGLETSREEKKRIPIPEQVAHLPANIVSAITASLKATVKKQADKGILKYSFAQKLLWDYLQLGGAEAVADMMETVREASLSLLASLDGARAVDRCFLLADAKERKAFVKNWKGQVAGLCSHEYGYMVLLRAIDSIDDTILTKKSLLSEILVETEDNLLNLITDVQGLGRKAFLHILAPFNPRYFTQEEITVLQNKEGSTSKKDSNIRQEELLEEIKDPLLKICKDQMMNILSSKFGLEVLYEVAKHFKDSDMLESLANVTCAPPELGEHEEEEEEINEQTEMEGKWAKYANDLPKEQKVGYLADPYGHLMLKRLLTDFAELDQNDAVKKFLDTMYACLKPRIKELAVLNRPALVLLAMLKCSKYPASKSLKADLMKIPKKSLKDACVIDKTKEERPGVKALYKSLYNN